MAFVTVSVACGGRTGLDVGAANGGAAARASSSLTATAASSTVTASSSGPSSSSASTSSSSSSTGAIEACPIGCPSGTATFPPAVPLQPPSLPASCAGGFEMNNIDMSFVAIATPPGGAEARTLDVEIATYKAPDHLRITGVDAAGVTYVLVDLCDLQTATYGDPTDHCSRPPDDAIRQYEVSVKAGTTSLAFDVTGACTPYYLRVLGLCDFVFAPPVPGCMFRILP